MHGFYFKSIAALLAATWPGAAGAADPDPPGNAILLFVASWCAPCHAEVRDLPALRRAAGPMRVLVVPVDATRQTRAMLARVPAEAIVTLEPARAKAWMRRLAGGAPGLPTSVAVDLHGTVCGVRREPLDAAAVATIRRGCGL